MGWREEAGEKEEEGEEEGGSAEQTGRRSCLMSEARKSGIQSPDNNNPFTSGRPAVCIAIDIWKQ